jgi:hypothetical protein
MDHIKCSTLNAFRESWPDIDTSVWNILAEMISAVSGLQRIRVLTTPNSSDEATNWDETYYDGIPEVFGEADDWDESYLTTGGIRYREKRLNP